MNSLAQFDVFSTISGILWFGIVVILAAWHYSSIREKSYAKYFLPTFYFKLISAVGFAVVYLYVYQDGGDTIAYWDGANNLTNLFYDSPLQFLSEMWYESDIQNIHLRFNQTTGYPPGWIYREPESFFVSKVLFFFSVITFKSYWATTFILAYFSTRISFSFFKVLREIHLHSDKLLAFALLFLPSVSFWCSGISKDTIVYLGLILLLRELISIYYLKSKIGFKNILFIIIGIYLMFQIRIYVLVAVIPAILVAYTRVIEIQNKTNQLKRYALKTVFYILGIGTIIVYTRVSTGGIENVLQEIIVTQQDFKNNIAYGDNKYTIEIQEYNLRSIVSSFPQALAAAIYRPFLWESRNISLILNGLEGTVLLYLTLLFFLRNVREKIRLIRTSEILIFSLVFVIIMGFSVGFTSGLFGVLVRLKAVILPFFILLIGIEVQSRQSESELNKSLEKE